MYCRISPARLAPPQLDVHIPDNELFTPMLDGKRVTMRVRDAANILRDHNQGFRGTIQDELTGKLYEVYGKPCALPGCHCDARVKEVQ